MKNQDSEEKSTIHEMVRALFKEGQGNHIDLVAAVYELFLKRENDQAEILVAAVSNYGVYISAEKVPVPASGRDVENLTKLYGPTVDAFLESLIERRLPEKEFYEKLVNFVNNPLFDTDDAKFFAFYWLVIDKRLPYFKLDGLLELSPGRFSEIIDENRPTLAKIGFVLATKFGQWSEQGSALLNIILAHEDPEVRAVLMAQALKVLRSEMIDSRGFH